MSDNVTTQTGRLQDIAFKVFALVGFVSSVVTIIAWASGSSASLTATVAEKTIEVPQSVQLSKFTDEKYTLNSALTDLSNKYCSPATVDYEGKRQKNYDYNEETCKKQTALYTAFRQIAALDGKPLLAYDIKITNDGTEVADNIRVRSPIDVSISVADADGGNLQVTTERPNRVFRLPSLNPRETLQVRLVSATQVPDEFENKPVRPTITFARGKANYRTFSYVSGRYSGVVKFLDDLPLAFQVVVIGFVALIITLIWLLPLSFIASAAEKRKKTREIAI